MAFFTQDLIDDLHSASKIYSASYAAPKSQTANIPTPEVFHDLYAHDTSALPSAAQCAVHLELLELFAKLREYVTKSNQLDVLFDTMPQKKYTSTSERRRGYILPRRTLLKPIKYYDTTFQERRKGKWKIFIDHAFARFRTWAAAVSGHQTTMIRELVVPGEIAYTLVEYAVPPLDILMIWHAFLLRPRFYREWCETQGLRWMGRANFPWKQIHAMIDSSKREFYLPAKHARAFQRFTGLPPNLLASLIEASKDVHMRDEQNRKPKHVETQNDQIFNASTDDIWQKHNIWVLRMCHFLWIRSPALEYTLRSAQSRYQNFFQLLALDSNATFVPTPDIELVWLTHQMSPLSFENFSKASVGRIVEHNVVAKESVDRQHIASTEKAFYGRFRSEYQRCFCWDCQNLQRLAEENSMHDKDPDIMGEKAMREVAYHRAVERDRRQKNTSRVIV